MILLSIRECFVNVTHKIINHKSSMYHSLHKYFLTIMSAVIIKKSVTFIFKMGIIRNFLPFNILFQMDTKFLLTMYSSAKFKNSSGRLRYWTASTKSKLCLARLPTSPNSLVSSRYISQITFIWHSMSLSTVVPAEYLLTV